MKPSNNTPKMKRRRKKKKASASPHQNNIRIDKEEEGGGEDTEEEEGNERMRAFNCLVEAFSSISIEEIVSAYTATGKDANKAAVILSEELIGAGEEEVGDRRVGEKSRNGGRRKKVVTASTGTVSTVLGKGYVGTGSKRKGFIESRAGRGDPSGRKEGEDFLCLMLGDECQLDFGLIRDVFCQCGYDVEKIEAERIGRLLIRTASPVLVKQEREGCPES